MSDTRREAPDAPDTSEAVGAPEAPAPSPQLLDRTEIDAAIAGLDRASRNFAETLAALEELREIDPGSAVVGGTDPDTAFECRMQEAELEARAYLSRAKSRADSLVATMIAAIEEQANEIRLEAENAIRSHWKQVEVEADRHLDDARRVTAGMVAERQERLAELSDGISGRADSLLGGMVDADDVRRQFDGFVAALSRTAAQIAAEASAEPAEPVAEMGQRRAEQGPDALAA